MKLFNNLFNRKNILPLMQQHVDDVRLGRKKKLNGDFYAMHSYYAQKTALAQFERFLSGRKITEKDITHDMLRRFSDYLQKENLAKTSIANNVKQLLIIIRRLMIEKKIKTFNIERVKTGRDTAMRVYLTEEELKKLKKIDLSLVEKLEGVRDLFLIQCYTSLRFSDAIRIARNPKPYFYEEDGRSYFKIIAQKTSQSLIIPLKREVLEILNNRDFKKITMSMQYYNKHLKELCKFAGIDEEVIHSITRGGRRIETVKKKYEMVSSHTGRRTFITNAVLAGIPLMQIQAISGHTTTQSLLNYLHASNLEMAKRSFDNEFFK